MNEKLTPWFPPDVKPARAGVYKTIMHFTSGRQSKEGWSLWTGGEWRNQFTSIQKAYADAIDGIQSKSWRGLASDPKASKP